MPPRGYTPDGQFPLLPAQLADNNAGLRRGEPSGQIYCPRKWSNIAVMRCGEYQEQVNCNVGCAVAASADEIARARAQIPRFENVSGEGTYTCKECGKPKKFVRSALCMSCGNIASNKINHRGRGL